MTSKAQIKASNEYNKKHMKRYSVWVNKNTEDDIIRHLETISGSKNGYIKKLIRKDMNG